MSTRQLWHDELFTYYIAQAPSLSRLWEELHLDLNPPMLYLARVLPWHCWETLYAVRRPVDSGVLSRQSVLYVWVARRLRPSYGLPAKNARIDGSLTA